MPDNRLCSCRSVVGALPLSRAGPGRGYFGQRLGQGHQAFASMFFYEGNGYAVRCVFHVPLPKGALINLTRLLFSLSFGCLAKSAGAKNEPL